MVNQVLTFLFTSYQHVDDLGVEFLGVGHYPYNPVFILQTEEFVLTKAYIHFKDIATRKRISCSSATP
jgi:hypothetical protein